MSITGKITNISVTKIPTVCNILYAILKVVDMRCWRSKKPYSSKEQIQMLP